VISAVEESRLGSETAVRGRGLVPTLGSAPLHTRYPAVDPMEDHHPSGPQPCIQARQLAPSWHTVASDDHDAGPSRVIRRGVGGRAGAALRSRLWLERKIGAAAEIWGKHRVVQCLGEKRGKRLANEFAPGLRGSTAAFARPWVVALLWRERLP